MLIVAKNKGFSIIELMVGVVIVSILIGVGFPAFNSYMQNTRVLATAESFNNMVQMARAEAVRRNANVDLILTNATAADTSTATSALKVANGTNWLVRTADLVNAGQFVVVDGKFAKEGATNIVVTGGADVITFNNLGGTTLGAAQQVTFASSVLACQPAGPVRCLTVRVGVGGQSRLCDLQVSSPTDTRSC